MEDKNSAVETAAPAESENKLPKGFVDRLTALDDELSSLKGIR